jgi:hypothetical protein
MASRTKAKSSDSRGQDTTADDTVKGDEHPLCGAVHPLPLLAHVTCRHPVGHTDDQQQAPDQDKHRAMVAGALYVW